VDENLMSGLESLDSGLILSDNNDDIIQNDRKSMPTYPTMMDTIIYLTDTYQIPLSDKKDLTFTYVTPKNPFYAQFRTAYDMHMI
jgi:hypothetical protein